jgi:hypothetical protein
LQGLTLYCQICGSQRSTLRGCCTLPDDSLSHSEPAPAWDTLSFAQQCLLFSLVRFGGEAREAEITRDVCITGSERRECVRDLDPPRGSTNLIMRSPHGPLAITRRYYLTDAGLAAFESNPNLIKADLGRIKKLRRLREIGAPSRLAKIADLALPAEDSLPDWVTTTSPAEIVEYHDEPEEHEDFEGYDDSLEDLCEAA